MGIWQTLRFGTQAVSLKRTAESPAEEIEQIQRRRLEKLVRHAREHSDFYREKYSNADDTTFQLSDLPPSTKPELMDNFDRTLTVPISVVEMSRRSFKTKRIWANTSRKSTSSVTPQGVRGNRCY